jgi:hypothetical protein
MNRTVRTLLSAAAVAGGLVIAAPAGPASACGDEGWTAAPTSALARQSVAERLAPVAVSGPGAIAVPAGGTGTFAVTVDNTGAGFRGDIELRVSTSGPAGLPAMTMEVAGSRGDTKTWRRLAAEGTPGSQWYAVRGLGFHTGEATTEFRLGVDQEAYGRTLRIVARVRDAAGPLVGTTTVDVTVTGAALQVRTSFPAELRRGGAYREFEVQVRNPSGGTYRSVTTTLSMTGLGPTPTPREAGYVDADVLRVEQRSGGGWQRVVVHPGCDPTPYARLGQPFDLAPGASRTLHLRIRITDSPATKLLLARWWMSAAVRGNPDASGSLTGDILIRPRLVVPRTPAVPPTSRPTAVPAPPASTAAPSATAAPPVVAAPVGLAETGPAIWPLVGVGGALLIAGGATLLAVRQRRVSRIRR